MFIDGRFYSRTLRAPNDGNESAGGAGAPDTAPKDEGGKEDEGKKTPETVPYDRFAEVNSKKKELETQLAAYQKKEAEENEKKRKMRKKKPSKTASIRNSLSKKTKNLLIIKLNKKLGQKEKKL